MHLFTYLSTCPSSVSQGSYVVVCTTYSKVNLLTLYNAM
jgi:hypothetical protein